MALSVAVYHLAVWTRAFSGGARDAVIVLGVYGVETFFLISGFCFFHLYAQRSFDGAELRSFHLKRFFRIAPLYYLAMVLGALFAFEQAVGPRVTPLRVVENVTMTFGLVHPNHAMVLGGWSIGLEYVFYLAFPALAFIARWRLAIYAVAIALVLWALPYNFGVVYEAAEARKFHAYVQLPNHAFLFAFGAVIADLRMRFPARIPAPASLVLLAVLVWSAALAQEEIIDHLEVMVGMTRVKYVVLCTVMVGLFAFTKLPRTKRMAPLLWLGELSYSVYLMHPFAWPMVQPILPEDMSPQAQLASGLAAALALSFITWRLVERPCNALGHKLAQPGPSSESVAGPARLVRSE